MTKRLPIQVTLLIHSLIVVKSLGTSRIFSSNWGEGVEGETSVHIFSLLSLPPPTYRLEMLVYLRQLSFALIFPV